MPTETADRRGVVSVSEPPGAAREVSPVIEMQAVVLREPGRPVSVETVLLAPPRRGEVLVRVAAAGVCHSDVHLADGLLGGGRWPMVLGHEGAGVVEAVGEDVADVAVGDHVAFCFVPSCGACGFVPVRAPDALRDRRTQRGRRGADGRHLAASRARRNRLQHGLMVACFASTRWCRLPAPSVAGVRVPLWQAALLGCGVVTGIGAGATARGCASAPACA